MKKRFISACLALALLSTSCIACGTTSKEENKNEGTEGGQSVQLKVWGSEEDRGLLEQITSSFSELHKKEANIEITIEGLTESECKEQLLGDVNNGPDVYTFADDQLLALAASGVLEEIAYSEEAIAENVESSIEASKIKDKVYAYPLTADNGYFMFYNKKYIDENQASTMDGLLEAAAKVGKKVSMDWSSGWYLYAFFGNTGMELGINDDGVTNYCNYNSTDGKIKGTDVAKAMYRISRSKGFLSIEDGGFVEGVKDGTIIAGVSGTWNAATVQEAWGEDYAAVKLPTFTCAGEQIQMASYAGYKMIGVNAYSAEKKWAEKLAQYISNEENQTLRFVERGQGPSNIKAGNSEEVGKAPAIQAVIAQSEFASLQRVGVNYWGPMETFGESFINGKAKESNLQDLLDTMVKGVTASTNAE